MLEALRTIHSTPTVKELAGIMSLSQSERQTKASGDWALLTESLVARW
jgi:hypothetical protein